MLGYLDAGSGSLIASAAAAGFAGAAVAGKVAWARVTGRAKKGKGDTAGESAAEHTDSTDAS